MDAVLTERRVFRGKSSGWSTGIAPNIEQFRIFLLPVGTASSTHHVGARVKRASFCVT